MWEMALAKFDLLLNSPSFNMLGTRVLILNCITLNLGESCSNFFC